MFCSNCGNKIENENANFCAACGFKLNSNAAPAPAAEPAPEVQPVAAEPVSKLKTNEEPTMSVSPKPFIVIQKAQQMAIRNQMPLPDIVHDPMFKAKCEYCMTVFTYHYSNLGYRKWYQHGFVYCPMCRKPLRHSTDLLIQECDIHINPDGSYSY